jgi:hypothetical protein
MRTLRLLEELLSITESYKDAECVEHGDRETWLKISAECADIREHICDPVEYDSSLRILERVQYLVGHIISSVETSMYLNASSWTQVLLGVLLHSLSKELKKVR